MKIIIDFLISADLWANIFGGIVAAIIFAWLVSLRDKKKHRILHELTVIMGRAIEHRDASKRQKDKKAWVQQAKAIEAETIAKATELSTTAGSLMEWLDKVDPYIDREVDKYVSILSKIIERIRELLERNS